MKKKMLWALSLISIVVSVLIVLAFVLTKPIIGPDMDRCYYLNDKSMLYVQVPNTLVAFFAVGSVCILIMGGVHISFLIDSYLHCCQDPDEVREYSEQMSARGTSTQNAIDEHVLSQNNPV